MDVGPIFVIVLAAIAVMLAYIVILSWKRIGLWSRLTAVAFLLVAVSSANWVYFGDASIRELGGTAKNGKIERGQFYVGDHGQYTKVTQSVYDRNLAYGQFSDLFSFVSWLTFMILLLWGRFVRRPRSVQSLAKASLGSILGIPGVNEPKHRTSHNTE